MDPSPKRRKLFQRAQDTFEGILRFSEHPIAHMMPADNKDPLGKQLPLRAAMTESLRTLNTRTRKDSPVAGQGKAKPHRLHPRQLGIYEAAAPVVQPIQTTVVSYINVVLDSGGTSIGNVLVPAESTIFSVDGYGPVTLDDYNPPNPTPVGSSLTSRPVGSSNAAQQTIQPETQQTQQDDSNAVASPSLPSPMSIQVPGSTSQVILSSPPTPLPPNPSNSTGSSLSSTASESYFGSTSSQNPDSTQTPSASDITSSQSTRAASVPPGNSTTLFVTSSQTLSGSTLVTTFPVVLTSTTNSTSYPSSSSGTLLTMPNNLNQSSTSSAFATNTNSLSTTSSLPVSTSLSTSLSSASASSTSADTGVPLGGDGTPTGTVGADPSSSSAATAGSDGGDMPSTPTLVGSVVGGLAGLALILILILFLLRRHKQVRRQRTISPPIPQSASTEPRATSGTMTERSSAAVPLASAAFFRRLRPGSGATATTTETTPSERGFQNLGGRKLESVLSSRGDGFGDIPFGAAGTSTTPGSASARGQPPPSIPITTGAPGAAPGHSSPVSLSGSSFYRDSQGFYGGPGQGQPEAEPASNSSSMFVGPASPPQSPTHAPSGIPQGQEGVAVMRPGPARTPITTPGGLSSMRGPPARGTPPPQIPGTIQERPRDGLGRSHPSMDGSRGSRFAENI
ncbi:MAG: hypothetical protein LQ337_005142 [Flavoplaca oasis]|nr:MAG: hypothetical protein LQ337_005142 [Flavoplaca oasis]